MKKIWFLICFVLLVSLPMLAQQATPQQAPPVSATVSPKPAESSKLADSLRGGRSLLTMAIYKGSERLSYADVRALYASNRKATRQLQWGRALRPVAPVLMLAGLAVGYMGLRGEQKTAFIRGVGTRQQPVVPDVEANYVQRSLPKTVLGLGLFLGAFCLIEQANEFTANSVRLYNAKPAPIRRPLARVDHLNIGLTSTGNLGLEAHF